MVFNFLAALSVAPKRDIVEEVSEKLATYVRLRGEWKNTIITTMSSLTIMPTIRGKLRCAWRASNKIPEQGFDCHFSTPHIFTDACPPNRVQGRSLGRKLYLAETFTSKREAKQKILRKWSLILSQKHVFRKRKLKNSKFCGTRTCCFWAPETLIDIFKNLYKIVENIFMLW